MTNETWRDLVLMRQEAEAETARYRASAEGLAFEVSILAPRIAELEAERDQYKFLLTESHSSDHYRAGRAEAERDEAKHQALTNLEAFAYAEAQRQQAEERVKELEAEREPS